MSETTKWVYFFGEGVTEGDPARTDLLGGKGASLAAMAQAGLPVPPGFTISTEVCPVVQASGGQWPDGLEEQVREAMVRLESITGRTYGHGHQPLLVAVRSGAAVSMPGMMDTILNCGMNTSMVAHQHGRGTQGFWRDYADHIKMFAESVAGVSPDVKADEPEALAMELLAEYEHMTGRSFPLDPWAALFQCIDAVFRSWNSERAIAYRKYNDIRGVIGTAVNVQAMFPSQRAGVLFTANPTTGDTGEMVLEASWGLGEAVVSGAVTPDIYTIDARTLAVREVVPGERPKHPDGTEEPALTDDEIRRVAELGNKVQNYFGVPQDVEWGLADGRLVLLQTRAVRGLDVLQDVEPGRQAEAERLLAAAAGKHVVWVVHNLAETLAAPTPLTWDIIRRYMGGYGGFGLLYQDLGYDPSPEVKEHGFLELICGRIYADPRRAARLYWGSMPYQYTPEEILADPSVLDRTPVKLELADTDTTFFVRLPRALWAMARCSRRRKRIRRTVVERFEQQIVPAFLRFVDECRRKKLQVLNTPDLLEELDRRRRIVLDDFGKESLKPGFFAADAQGNLTNLLTQILGPDAGPDLARVLTTGLENDITVDQNILLYRVAQGQADFEQFLEKHGHRTVNEMELAQPRWREDPDYLQMALKSFHGPDVVSPEERHGLQTEARKRAESELPARLAECGGSALCEKVLFDLHNAQRLLPYREIGKYYLMMGYEQIRAVLVELARRWELGRDLFFLQLDELRRYESERHALVPKLLERKRRWRSAQKLHLGDVIDSEHLDHLGLPPPRKEGEGLTARAIASGVAVGLARIVFNPQEARDLGTGYILVCPSTDPGWTPLFVNAKGLVVERGGVLSHGAIVARDFGIPAVVCPRATELIPDKARVQIDGNRGSITLLDG